MSEERPRHQRIKNIGNYLLQTVKKDRLLALPYYYRHGRLYSLPTGSNR